MDISSDLNFNMKSQEWSTVKLLFDNVEMQVQGNVKEF